MAKLFKIISRNKKTLILVLGLGLFLSFLPFQFIKSSLVSVADASFYCEPLGGISQNYRCIGTIPSSACNNLIDINTNCNVKCRDAGGVTARWGTITSWDPYNLYCCNLRNNTSCGPNNSITLNTAPNPVDLTTGTMPLPVSLALEGCSWTNPFACFGALANYLITLPIRTGALFIVIPLAIIAMATGILYTIITVLLGWFKAIVLSVPILPSQVDVVQAGWEITRNLANMGFILILVFIGLATILRIKDYEAKKLLPTLIIVALLINFSPVIVGFVVDISNIITNFFLNLGSWESTATAWSMIWNYFKDAFAIMTQMGQIWAVIGNIIGTIILGVVLICFFGYSAWIYLLVAALLVVRIIVLWILMILAPLAFLFYVLPAGKKLAKEWWQQLVQWAILAIPLGFFLFLSFKVLEATTRSQIEGAGFFKVANLKASTTAAVINVPGIDFGNFTSQLANAFGVMLVPLVSIVILHIGYKLSKSYMPAAAKGIISGIEKGFKMAAGAALVVATGGAAAGLAAGGLGKLAQGVQGVENFMGRIPVLGKPLKYLSKPMSWATRGMEKAATPALLEYQAKTRRVPEADIKKIDGMSGVEAENYINAKTKMLPKGIAEKQRLQYTAHMADKNTLKFTSPEFQKEATTLANKTFEDENPYFQKEANTILNSTGGMTEEALVHSKLFGMPDKTVEDKEARKKKGDEIRQEILKTKGIIEERMGMENFIVEAAIELKYITREEATSSDPVTKAHALTTARAKAVGQDLRNIAAAATYRKESKPEDIKDIINPDNLADRVGLTLGNPRNLQKVQDNFGQKKFKGVIEGAGGLDSATDTSDKLDYYAKYVNPAMIQTILNTPAGREINLKARNNMLDPDDQPTNRSTDFNDRIRIQKGLESHAELGKYDGDKKNEATLVEKINETEADLRKLETEMRGAENERKRLEKEAKDAGTESIRLAAEARRATGSKKTDLEAESRKTEIEQGKLENRAKKAEAERIRLETAVNTERAKISPIVSGPKATLRGLQSQIATEKTTIEADRELNRIWKEIEELRK